MMGALWITFSIVSGLTFDGDWGALLVISLIIALLNATIVPVVKLISLPARILTLGLFTLVINVAAMALVLWISEEMDLGVDSTGWGATILGALILTVLSSIISRFVED